MRHLCFFLVVLSARRTIFVFVFLGSDNFPAHLLGTLFDNFVLCLGQINSYLATLENALVASRRYLHGPIPSIVRTHFLIGTSLGYLLDIFGVWQTYLILCHPRIWFDWLCLGRLLRWFLVGDGLVLFFVRLCDFEIGLSALFA